MSRLALDIDLPERPRHEPLFGLRQRRRRPLHPQTVKDLLAAKAAQRSVPPGWRWPFGWLLRVRMISGEWRGSDLPSSLSYAEACERRQEALEEPGAEMAWLTQKTGED